MADGRSAESFKSSASHDPASASASFTRAANLVASAHGDGEPRPADWWQRCYRRAYAASSSAHLLRVGHRFRADHLVELFGGEETELHTGFTQGKAIVVSFFGNFGCFVVADVRRQGGDQH